jgi:ubiquinone/menaquinone biosynthesis C-methylase UbiE
MAVAHKPYKGLPMEGIIATWYARNTANDVRGTRKLASSIADRLKPGERVLEVAPGPGYLAVEIAKMSDYKVSGLDISHSFIRIASENARKAGVSVDFRHGDAAHMPFPDGSFDFVVCRAAFKNFSDPVGAINEMHRVLMAGGQASIIDLRKDASLTDIDDEVAGMHLSALNAKLTKWTFRHLLLKSAYTREAIDAMVSQSRFTSGEVLQDGIGFELRLAKK